MPWFSTSCTLTLIRPCSNHTSANYTDSRTRTFRARSFTLRLTQFLPSYLSTYNLSVAVSHAFRPLWFSFSRVTNTLVKASCKASNSLKSLDLSRRFAPLAYLVSCPIGRIRDYHLARSYDSHVPPVRAFHVDTCRMQGVVRFALRYPVRCESRQRVLWLVTRFLFWPAPIVDNFQPREVVSVNTNRHHLPLLLVFSRRSSVNVALTQPTDRPRVLQFTSNIRFLERYCE